MNTPNYFRTHGPLFEDTRVEQARAEVQYVLLGWRGLSHKAIWALRQVLRTLS